MLSTYLYFSWKESERLLCYIDLQDFYLDLVEDNRKITPRDYLELALRPVEGGRRDVAAKNEVTFILSFQLQNFFDW